MRRRLLVTMLFVLLTVGCFSVEVAAAQVPTKEQQKQFECVFVNGTELKTYLADNPGMGYVYIDENQRTMVPLRAVGDVLGLQTEYRSSDGAIIVDGGSNGQVIFHLGKATYSVGGTSYTMDTKPVTINGRTHIPIRFLVESLGGIVYYTPRYETNPGAVVEIYFHANDVTPTAPDWAKDDYVTFERTAAYTPENWAVITDLRNKASRGEDISKESSSFRKKFLISSGIRSYDYGVQYEMLLLDTKNKANGYAKGSSSKGTVSLPGGSYTQEQKNSIARWEMRDKGAGTSIRVLWLQIKDLYYQDIYGVDMNNENGIRSYTPACAEVIGKSLPEFFAEPWFKSIKNCPAPIYFDGDCPDGNPASSADNYPTRWYPESVYTEQGITRVDLDLVGAALGLKHGSTDYHVSSPSIAWAKEERDSNGNLAAVEMDWDGTTIRVSQGSSMVKIGDKSVYMDGSAVLHTDPVLKRARLYVPMSFLTKVLGDTVTYDKSSGIWFVERTHQHNAPTLEQWALGMSAVLCQRGEGNPYYFGMYNRCIRTQTQFVPSPADPDQLMRYYSFYPAKNIAKMQLEKSWGCTRAEDIRTQAQLLTANPNSKYPAWDLFRVAHIASWGYAAEYLTAEEALGLVKPAVQKLQQNYTCWDDAYADWIDGYRVVFGGTEDECMLRRNIYDQLKADQAQRGVLFDDTLFAKPLV